MASEPTQEIGNSPIFPGFLPEFITAARAFAKSRLDRAERLSLPPRQRAAEHGPLPRSSDAGERHRGADCYDRFGDTVRKVQTDSGQSFTLRYGYDVAARLIALTHPDGAIASYARDSDGRIGSIESDALSREAARKYTCRYQVDINGISPDNCSIVDQEFAFGYGEGPGLAIRKETRRKECE